MSQQTYKKFVLYVSSDDKDATQFCYGSRECLKLIEPLKEDVTVQHVDRMLEAGVEIPDWLNGTPILVNTMEKSALRGTDAFNFLRDIDTKMEVAEEENEVSNDLFQGMISDDENYMHDMSEEGNSKLEANSAERQILNTHEGKITENDLQRYMELRNKTVA